MTECARCGDCCDPVVLTFDPQEKAKRLLSTGDGLSDENRRNYEFMLEHWRVIRPIVSARGYGTDSYEVKCDQYDRATKSCLAQDDKPPVCADYPWYGRDEDDKEGRRPVAEQLSPRCSFNADVPGRQMLPLFVVTNGE